ncbi:hypothetical protein cand_009790 [Cryptosporidium andersoni]|uniref:Uncharacterized protein n=1 Tax=Cryptosporidium andersoni TaxID=117008 RepID=A0A1J4MSW1_9CRYT|nr:hypothetical protein cand_009790 [Cryptosporidium andersoni]
MILKINISLIIFILFINNSLSREGKKPRFPENQNDKLNNSSMRSNCSDSYHNYSCSFLRNISMSSSPGIYSVTSVYKSTTPTISRTLKISGTSKIPELSEMSDLSETSDMLEIPKIPKIPKMSDLLETSNMLEMPKMSELSEISDLLETSNMLEMPKMSELSEMSDLLETSNMLEIPKIPKMPKVTRMLEISKIPKITKTANNGIVLMNRYDLERVSLLFFKLCDRDYEGKLEIYFKDNDILGIKSESDVKISKGTHKEHLNTHSSLELSVQGVQLDKSSATLIRSNCTLILTAPKA